MLVPGFMPQRAPKQPKTTPCHNTTKGPQRQPFSGRIHTTKLLQPPTIIDSHNTTPPALGTA